MSTIVIPSMRSEFKTVPHAESPQALPAPAPAPKNPWDDFDARMFEWLPAWSNKRLAPVMREAMQSCGMGVDDIEGFLDSMTTVGVSLEELFLHLIPIIGKDKVITCVLAQCHGYTADRLSSFCGMLAHCGGGELAKTAMAAWLAVHGNHIRTDWKPQWLWLDDLPEGLKVDGHLDLGMTQIDHLPSGMVVGSLDLGGCRVRELPGDLVIQGSSRGYKIWMNRICPLSQCSEEAIWAMAPGAQVEICIR